MKNTIQFPKPKPIDHRKFIQPMEQIFVTKNGLTTALLIPLKNKSMK